VDLKADFLQASEGVGGHEQSAFSDYKVQGLTVAVVGEECDFDVAAVSAVRGGFELEILYGDGEVDGVTRDRSFEFRVGAGAGGRRAAVVGSTGQP